MKMSPASTSTQFSLSNQPPEVLHAVEGDDVAVVGGAGVLVAGTADDAEVVAVDDHRGVVPGGMVGGPDGNEASEGPAK